MSKRDQLQDKPINVTVLTVSDTRTQKTDLSGKYLSKAISDAGHIVLDHKIILDDIYQIRAQISTWIADSSVDVIISTGGTGVSGRDSTPEAIMPLLDKTIDGFGELFRMLSYKEIGASTIQSRAIAGVANATYLFVLPGSNGACRLAWDKIIDLQLNSNTKPCNLIELIPRLKELNLQP